MKTKYVILFVFTIQLALSGMSQVTDDIEIVSSWIRGENNGGLQYGRTPSDQQDTKYWVGSTVHNAGTNDQTNITLTADYGSFSSGGTIPFLAADSTVTIETLESLSLLVNLYSGNHVITSDADTIGGANFGNNTMLSEFEITGGSPWEYSLDGIGVYSNPQISAIGTVSFIGGEDGLVLATKYISKQSSPICGIRVLLADSSIAGGEIYGSIKDSATFWSNDMTSLYYAIPETITNSDILNGYIDLFFSSTLNFSPGAYYAAIELYSNGNSNDIHILDDLTITQPEDASAIFIPGDTIYSFGNALGIQLINFPECYWGLDENVLSGVSIYPNPSKGEFTITNDDLKEITINIYSVLGEKLNSKIATEETKLDLSHLGAGVYIINVSSSDSSITKRVIVE